MRKLISYKQLILRIIFLITFSVGVSFAAYGYFIQTQSIKKSLDRESSLMVDLIFENLFTAMKNGANKEDLDLIVNNIEKKMPSSSIKIHNAKEPITDPAVLQVYLTKEAQFNAKLEHVDFVKPIIFKKDCIACHTDFKEGDVGGVVELKHSMFDLNIPLREIMALLVVLFLISISILFLIFYFVILQLLLNDQWQLAN
jgi:hypothetical protein